MARLRSAGTISTFQGMGSKNGFKFIQGSLHVLRHGGDNFILANNSFGLGHGIYSLASIDSFSTHKCRISCPACLFDGLYQASKNYAPATMLTFAGLATGATVGLFLGVVVADFWCLVAVPAALAVLSGVISGSTQKISNH